MLRRAAATAAPRLRPATSRLRLWHRHSSAMSSPVSPSSDAPAAPQSVVFTRSPVPDRTNPVQTAAALIIGDEILNGKTQDTNSHYFARRCFDCGIELKRIEVVPDEEETIIEAARRLAATYDLVVTSGGIGPTHDDITYASLGRAFNQDLVLNQEVRSRMDQKSMYRKEFLAQQTDEQRTARERMALFPEKAEVLFVTEDLWVPVVRLEKKLCILPGIPSLFRRLLDALMEEYVTLPELRPFRHMVFTTLPESSIAPYLTELQRRVKNEGVRIGSYPALHKGVTVSLIGYNEARVLELGLEVSKEIQGDVVKKDA